MRRPLPALALAALLLTAPSSIHARVRVGWLVTAIGTSAASAGLAAGSILFFGVEDLSRRLATDNSWTQHSYPYEYESGGRWYTSYGKEQLTLADTYHSMGWVYAGGAVVTGVVSIVAWTRIKGPPRPRADAGPAPLLAYADGGWTLDAPELRFDPLRGGVSARLLRAEF